MDPRYGAIKLKVPPSFPMLLQKFTREVLREQPLDIAEFAANYFQSLVTERKVTGQDPLANDPFDQPGYHAPPQKILRPISSEVRQEEIKREKAATKIQAGYKGYRSRRASRAQQQYLQKRHGAAAKIQANYRGYRTRQSLKKQSPVVDRIQSEVQEKPVAEDWNGYGDEGRIAAVRIQANVRGYLTRKSLAQRQQLEEDKMEHLVMPEIRVEETENVKTEVGQDQERVAESGQLGDIPEQDEVVMESKDLQETNKEEELTDEKQPDTVSVESEGKEKDPESIDAVDEDREAEEAAAVKIQASFRGLRTRKMLQEQANQASEQNNNFNTGDTTANESEHSDEGAAEHLSKDDDKENAADSISQYHEHEPNNIPDKDDEKHVVIDASVEERKQEAAIESPRNLEDQYAAADTAASVEEVAEEHLSENEEKSHADDNTSNVEEQEAAADETSIKEDEPLTVDGSPSEEELALVGDGTPRSVDLGTAGGQTVQGDEPPHISYDTPRIEEELKAADDTSSAEQNKTATNNDGGIEEEKTSHDDEQPPISDDTPGVEEESEALGSTLSVEQNEAANNNVGGMEEGLPPAVTSPDDEETESKQNSPHPATEETAGDYASERYKEAATVEDVSSMPQDSESTVGAENRRKEAAAVKIQSGYRGYRARKHLKSAQGEKAPALEDSNKA